MKRILRLGRWLNLLLPVTLGILFGCHSGGGGYQTTPEGLTYKFYQQNKAGIGVMVGDMITADVVFRTKDSVFFVSSRDLTVPYQFEILEPRFPGDIYDAFLIMAVGDSATFVLDGDSLFMLDFEITDYPGFIDATTDVYMDVRLLDVLPKSDFDKEKEFFKERTANMLKEMKEKEQSDIRAYLDANGYDVKPTESGLYFIELEKGRGPSVQPGKSVKVDYSAMFINKEIFETTIRDIAVKYDIFDSSKQYQPFTYIPEDSLTIAGWTEGLSYMKQGGRAILVIPSVLAYGEEGVEGYITPFTPLIYEIKVVEVN